MTHPERKKQEEELSQLRRLLDLTVKHQEKQGLRPYSHPDHYDDLCAKGDKEK
tara:strand:- start:1023 stop:1181 length:159 start_codon:yes stop_codon:yes gene_type:complete